MMLGIIWNYYFSSNEVFVQCKNVPLFAEFALIWRKNLLIARTVCSKVLKLTQSVFVLFSSNQITNMTYFFRWNMPISTATTSVSKPMLPWSCGVDYIPCWVCQHWFWSHIWRKNIMIPMLHGDSIVRWYHSFSISFYYFW